MTMLKCVLLVVSWCILLLHTKLSLLSNLNDILNDTLKHLYAVDKGLVRSHRILRKFIFLLKTLQSIGSGDLMHLILTS